MVELAGEYEFAAPQELVWEMLLDPNVLANTIPGCQELNTVDDHTFQGQLNIRVGPVQGVFQGQVQASDLHPPVSFHITVNGNGPAGVVRGEGDMMLESRQEKTLLHYNGNVQISGRIASVGQRLMDSSARSIVKQSLQNLDSQVQARLLPAPAAAGGAAAESVVASAPVRAPSQTEFMVNVTRDVIADFIPDPQQRRLVIGLGAAAAAIGLVNLFANLVARRVAKMLKEQ